MNYYFFLDACTNSGVLKTILFIETFLKVILYVVPIGLILMVMIDLSKSVLSSDENAMQKNLKLASKRIFSAVIFFLVPTISKFAVNLASDTAISDYTTCLTNTNNIAYYETLEAEKKKLEEEKTKEWYSSLDNDATYKSTIWKLSANQGISGGGSGSSGGVYNGQTYQLSTGQLSVLAAVSSREQGSVDGAMAEASLMANLFELSGGEAKYGTGAEGLLNYVRTSGWFGSDVDNATPASQEISDAVQKVLISGQRTLPLYVNEHDCWFCNDKDYCSNGNMGDICTVGGNSSKSYITNRSNYVQDKTVIVNTYGSTYTFYTFPAKDSDPFGYTQEAYNKIKGSNRQEVSMKQNKKKILIVVGSLLFLVLIFAVTYRTPSQKVVKILKKAGYTNQGNSAIYSKLISNLNYDQYSEEVEEGNSSLYEENSFDTREYEFMKVKMEYADKIQTNFTPKFDYKTRTLTYTYRVVVDNKSSVIFDGSYNSDTDSLICENAYTYNFDIEGNETTFCDKIKVEVKKFYLEMISVIEDASLVYKMMEEAK